MDPDDNSTLRWSTSTSSTLVPLHEQFYQDLKRISASLKAAVNLEDELCFRCKKPVAGKQDEFAVALGESFFHPDCFKCAKCKTQITVDIDVILLSDGSPICPYCSYDCDICHFPIIDDAITVGDEAYHIFCFKCKNCGEEIEELVFAKTSRGIYCMKCHNKRLEKIRERALRESEVD